MQQVCILYFCPNNGSKQFQTLTLQPPRQNLPYQWSLAETSAFTIFTQLKRTLKVLFLNQFCFRTVWRLWAPTSILSASAAPTAARSLPTSLSTWRMAYPTVRRVRMENKSDSRKNIINTYLCFYFRLERVVHDQVHCLRVSHWGWGPLGGGSQQQLPLTMF